MNLELTAEESTDDVKPGASYCSYACVTICCDCSSSSYSDE